MNEHEKDFQHTQQVAEETAALTEQVKIKLSDAAFEHFQRLVDTQPAVLDRLKQAAQLLDQEGF